MARADEARVSVPAWRLRDGDLTQAEATVIVEEPLEICVDGARYAVVMRTPGDDVSLAAGFCLGEGLVDEAHEIGGIVVREAEDPNRVMVTRAGARASEGSPARAAGIMVASSCRVCGREMVEDIVQRVPEITREALLSAKDLLTLGQRMQEGQRHFRPTGGTHAAALFDRYGERLAFGEDVGRHNALDKAIGQLLVSDRLGEACVAVLSGRCSFEMVQKAARAGIPVVASVSAPTHLAIELAKRLGMALVGFLRGKTFTVYAHGGRLEGIPE